MPDKSTSSRLGQRFVSPPAEDRPMAFWSWNGDISETGIEADLEAFKAHGFGGAFVHPRPGMITEYLSERWWHLWAFALAKAKSLDMELHIYDENSFPSGFAGGHVPSRDPDLVATYASLLPIADPEQVGRTRASAFIVLLADGEENAARQVTREEAQSAAEGRGSGTVVAVVMNRAPASAFMAGFGYVDLTHPDTTKAFLETTYHEYADRVSGDFGGAVKYAFTDEPNPAHGDGYAVSPYILAEFADEHGYRLQDRWADLFFGDGAVRHDYFLTVDRLFLDNFVSPVDEWCRAHGLGFTGHYWEHSWPSPGKQPDNMAAMARMAVPGNDLLEFQINRPDFWPKAVLNLKELSSVAAQNGSVRTMVENGGAGGYDTGIWEFKKTDLTLLSFGVTLFAPHLTHYSLAGARKFEWPQTLGEPASWWKHYGSHADHVARVVTLLAAGKEVNRVALVEPTRSGWLHFVPSAARSVAQDAVAGHELKMHSLGAAFCSLVLQLYQSGIDFDLVDERSLAAATVSSSGEGGTLRVGERDYSLVLLSETTETLARASVDVLISAADSGVAVLMSGKRAPGVDGRVDRPATDLQGVATALSGDGEMVMQAARRSPPRHIVSELAHGATWHRRVLADGSILYLFGNSADEPVTVTWKAELPRLYRLDTDTGSARPVSAGESGSLTVAPRGLEVFIASESDIPATMGFALAGPGGAPPALQVRPLADADRKPGAGWTEAVVTSCVPAGPNALVIDYCDLARDGESHRDLHFLAADDMLWQWAGWHGNAWDRAVQFRRNIVERTYRHVVPRITYRFSVDGSLYQGAPESVFAISAVVERVELYTVSINGRELPRDSWKPWRTREFWQAEIGRYLVTGDNELVLQAREFHPLMEISAVTLLGSFGLMSVAKGFAITAPGGLTTGDATAQGLPFYHDEVEYQLNLAGLGDDRGPAGGTGNSTGDDRGPAGGTGSTTGGGRDSAYDVLLEFGGAYAEVVTADESLVVYQSPSVVTVPARRCTVRVGANPRNYWGPFHSDGLALTFTWRRSPEHQPPGSSYNFRPTGLLAPPQVRPISGPSASGDGP